MSVPIFLQNTVDFLFHISMRALYNKGQSLLCQKRGDAPKYCFIDLENKEGYLENKEGTTATYQ